MNKSEIPWKGVTFAFIAFGLWGVFPVYWKMIAHRWGFEIVAHRVVWSIITGIIILKWILKENSLGSNWRLSGHKKYYAMGGLFICTNWSLYIYAVQTFQVVEGSLGYYINPLFNVFLGRLILKEKLSAMQWSAVALAAIGVFILAFQLGKLPFIALGLAMSFSMYGLIKKNVKAGSLSSVVFENMFLSPFAILFLSWVYWTDPSGMGLPRNYDWLILIGSGLVTLAPLYCFAQASRHLRLSTLGFFQYLGPSIQLAIAVFLFKEPFGKAHLASFAFIWGALLLYTLSNFKRQPRA